MHKKKGTSSFNYPWMPVTESQLPFLPSKRLQNCPTSSGRSTLAAKRCFLLLSRVRQKWPTKDSFDARLGRVRAEHNASASESGSQGVLRFTGCPFQRDQKKEKNPPTPAAGRGSARGNTGGGACVMPWLAGLWPLLRQQPSRSGS